MAIGLGIVLIVVGLILVLDVVNVDTSVIDTGTLGWILLVAGVLAIVISLVVNQQRTRRDGGRGAQGRPTADVTTPGRAPSTAADARSGDGRVRAHSMSPSSWPAATGWAR